MSEPALNGDDTGNPELTEQPTENSQPETPAMAALTPKQRKAEEQYQRLKTIAVGKDFSSIEALNIVRIEGVDNEGRRIVVVDAPNLPAKTVDLKLLLLYFITVLDPVVNEDYTLVFIGTNISGDNRPPTEWLSTAYTMFNRKYKKNLKALFIIHPTTMVRFVLGVVRPFISAKFWRKLEYIEDIQKLYNYMGQDQIRIPNSVIRFNAKKFPPLPSFGSPLAAILAADGNLQGIPKIVEDCIEYLSEGDRLSLEGIFRKSGENTMIKQLMQAYDNREYVDLNIIEDPHVVSCLLKRFLGAMADPLFPYEYYDILLQFYRLLAAEYPDVWVKKTAGVLKSFPKEHFRLIKVLFPFLGQVTSQSDQNLMTASSLATVIGPNILKTKVPPKDLNELHEANNITELFILHYHELIEIAEEHRQDD